MTILTLPSDRQNASGHFQKKKMLFGPLLSVYEKFTELVQTGNFFDMSLDPSFTPLRQSNLAKFVTMQVNKVYKRLRLRNDVKYRENLF